MPFIIHYTRKIQVYNPNFVERQRRMSEVTEEKPLFSDYNFHPDLQEGLDSFQFKHPTPVQQQAIPLILEGHDIIGVAQTGTGKTAAFLLPVLNKILVEDEPRGKVNTLVIVPTRELAVQVDTQCQGLGYFTGLSSLAIYGGGDGATFDSEKKALTKGSEIIVATPGRLISHLNMGYVDFKSLKHLVLDEADRMLDMGFYDDIVKIVNYLPAERQTLMFSATMPSKIRQLSQKLLRDPKEISIAISRPAEKIKQGAYIVYDGQKIMITEKILEGREEQSTIIFSGSKKNVKELAFTLKKKGYNAAAIHSDLEQGERESILLNFRNRRTKIIVATDVLSRGIDIEGIDLVINFDVPADGEDYIHRIGRTARAAANGEAITLVAERDQRYFQKIEKLIGREIEKYPLPEGFGTGPEYAPQTKSSGHGRPFKKGGNFRARPGRGPQKERGGNSSSPAEKSPGSN